MPTLTVRDLGYGYDEFGLSKRALRTAFAVAWPLYRLYFRVASEGSEHIPRNGAAIVVANHSGVLPFDGMMLCMDVAHCAGRVVRPVADHFVAGLPLVSVALQRIGAVGGAAGNVRALLEAGELPLIFPEGVPGIAKSKSEKYHLAAWRPGHAELALRARVPVIPAAVIGAEEQIPFVSNSKLLGRFVGTPHVPLPLLPFPLPVKYRILYGEPLIFNGDADDPKAVRSAAAQTRTAVEELIARGLKQRRSVFL